ncbi:MAG: hypothetical protein EAZ95_04155 [Bacteroidetes bacterium]|nr:MAG: hypothetical protein EAZ95_04155 [Bacteroidota bacterium]
MLIRFFWLACLACLPTMVVQASSPTLAHDTTKRKRIEYVSVAYSYYETTTEGNRIRQYGQRTYYYFEGDTLDRDITARNLIKDIRIRAVRKEIRKARLSYKAGKLLGWAIMLMPVTFLVLALAGVFSGVSVGWSIVLWLLGIFVGVSMLVIGGLLASSGDKAYQTRLMRIIDKYNEGL